jgi:hypothetical protein
MKNDEQEVSQQPQRSDTENPGTTAEPLANNNGQETVEPGRAGAGEASEKPSASSRKIEANRRNGRKSTGPKTAAGKKRVARNALKHGFYSKYLLVQHVDGAESQAEYNNFYADVFEHFQPEGWLEKNLVEKVAVCSLRLRRVIRHESGRISLSLAEHSYELQQAKADSAQDPGSTPASSPEMDAMTDHLFLTSEGMETQLRQEAMINRQLNHALAELERLQAARKKSS